MSAAAPVRIAIADDHRMFREGLRKLLESESDLRVVAQAHDADSAVDLVRTERPDVLLLDLVLPGASGLDALRALLDEDVPTRVIMLAAAIGRTEIVQALQLGARGVILKEAASELLIEGIRAVMEGQFWLGDARVPNLHSCMRRTLDRSSALPPTIRDLGLTAREREILEALVEGAGNREIAERFRISEVTVKHHLANMFDKCGVSSRLELALYAVRHGLVRV